MVLKKVGTVVVCGAMFLGTLAACGNAGSEPAIDGKKLFEQHCMVCHKDGGNIINPKKTLKSSDLKANDKDSVDAIVKTMRNPGPGMSTFDKNTVPDKEAEAIAKYVLSAF